MKKVIIILLVLLYCIDSMGQAISNRSSSTITVKDSRWMAGLNAFVPVYTDTTTANLTANIGIDSCGAIIFTYDNNNIWYRGCSPKRWLAMGSGQIINDTIYTERPIAVKVDSSGRHIIYFLTARGLISGGIVTLDSCMTIDVNNTVFNLNYNQYTVPQNITPIVISPADPTFDRVDRIVVDTNLNIVVIEGTPSATPLPAPIDIFSQFELMQITVPAGATCLNINQEIIYDQNIEWTITTSGTITEDPDNTANPYHLTKAIFVSSYHNGSSIIFTNGSPDTVTAGELLKMFIYINGAFTNQISGQWYNGSTSVSNQISLNPYFNTNDSTKYQNLSVPFTAWNFTSTILNRFVLTFGGDDISGAKGLYLDYIQLQKGLNNLNPLDFVDSNRISNDSLFYYKHGLSFYVGQVGGGGGNGLNIYNGDSSLSSSRTLELNDKFFKISQGGADVAMFDGTGGGLGVDAIELTAMNDPNSNRTSLNIQSFPDSSYFALDNTFNDGEHITKIHGTADAISGRMELTADTLTFNGTIIYNTPTSGLSTDSILTIDAATGIVNMRDASSFGNNSQDTSFTANLLIYTNTLTPTGVLENEAAFKAALIGSTPGDNNDSIQINGFRIVSGSGAGQVGLIEISISRLIVIPEDIFLGNTEITGFEDLGSLLSSGSEIRQGAFKNSTLQFFSAPIFGDINSSNMGDSAFFNCNNLSSVYLPAWDASPSTNIFQSCDILSHITVRRSEASVTSISTTNDFMPTILGNRLPSFTVSNLPTGTQGDMAYVTDATAPLYNATLVGSGSVVTIAFFNGTNWVAH